VEYQKHHPNFNQESSNLLFKYYELERYFIEEYGMGEKDLENLKFEIKKILAYTIEAARTKMNAK
jgi:hypothetical protein